MNDCERFYVFINILKRTILLLSDQRGCPRTRIFYKITGKKMTRGVVHAHEFFIK